MNNFACIHKRTECKWCLPSIPPVLTEIAVEVNHLLPLIYRSYPPKQYMEQEINHLLPLIYRSYPSKQYTWSRR